MGVQLAMRSYQEKENTPHPILFSHETDLIQHFYNKKIFIAKILTFSSHVLQKPTFDICKTLTVYSIISLIVKT